MNNNLAALLFGECSIAAKAVPVVDAGSSSPENRIIAWINSNPPDLPDPQNDCAACGEFIPIYDSGWVYLADGALIHYSGKHGTKCLAAWQKKRRDAALASEILRDE